MSSVKKSGGGNSQSNCAAVRKSPPTVSHLINLPGIALDAHVVPSPSLGALYVNGPRLAPLKPLTVAFPPAKYLV